MTGLLDKLLYVSVFSLNFSSAGQGPFMAGKENNMHQRCNLLGGWGQWSERHGPALAGKFWS